MADTEKRNSDNLTTKRDVADAVKRPAQVWSWLLGAVGGALIVGAVWATVAHVQSKPVIAKVGNYTIDRDAFYSKLEANSGSQMLQQMITTQLIKDGAAKYHITATQDDINKATQQFAAQYGVSSPDQLNAMLAQYHMTLSDFQDIIKTQVLEQKLAEKDVKVTDKDIQDFYNAHMANYTKQGEKTPQPLSVVRSQVINDYKQSKAVPAAQLLANLAKDDPITILDPKYSNIKSMIENPATAQTAQSAQTQSGQ